MYIFLFIFFALLKFIVPLQYKFKAIHNKDYSVVKTFKAGKHLAFFCMHNHYCANNVIANVQDNF